MKHARLLLTLLSLLLVGPLAGQPRSATPPPAEHDAVVAGRVVGRDGQAVDYATVALRPTGGRTLTAADGRFSLQAPRGDYELVVAALGYDTVRQAVTLRGGERLERHVRLSPTREQTLGEAQVTGAAVDRVERSAFNAVAIDTRPLRNSTKTLAAALAAAPSVKLRESGGVGSATQLTMDGFSSKHVKVFIDGVPQEGVGAAFGLSNVPVAFAERIEVYRGVVPVGFGADALGGVVNVVTRRQPGRWALDASYSYGSFNTHRTHVHAAHTLRGGWAYEVTAFQNYSDNDYHVTTPVEQFTFQPDGSVSTYIDTRQSRRVKRWNDTYHNEALAAKVGIVDRPWAERLMLGLTYAHMYQEVQTGVRQLTVFGDKHRRGHSLMPQLEYRGRDLFVPGLDVAFTLGYVRSQTTNVDTSRYHYNWLGERYQMNSPGEQQRQHARATDHNWNSTLTATYRLGQAHTLMASHTGQLFSRTNASLLAAEEQQESIGKRTRKHVTGLSYRLMPGERWNVAVFGKYYRQHVSGPMATNANYTAFVATERSVDAWGYGAAGTWFALPGLQAKASMEKAVRLPSIEELFGDEDLEMGGVGVRPERSLNLNLSLSYSHRWGRHALYAEAGYVFRDTRDYIQRNVADLSGGREAATYVNYGRVRTQGLNLSARYRLARWLSLGGSFTEMNVRDHQRQRVGSTAANLAYGARMPNVPYRFADADATLTWHDLLAKGHVLSLTYECQYAHSFSYYSEAIGTGQADYMVPTQLAHNLSLGYSIDGRYHLSLECRNLTDERLYDNFSLQRPGRAVYAKVRVSLGR